MSLFVKSTCSIVNDIVVNHLSWSNMDQIAALSSFTVDDDDKETSQVIFVTNEV